MEGFYSLNSSLPSPCKSVPAFQTKTGLGRFFLPGQYCAICQLMLFLGPDGLALQDLALFSNLFQCSRFLHFSTHFLLANFSEKIWCLTISRGKLWKSNWKVKVLLSDMNSMPYNSSFQQRSRQTFWEKGIWPICLPSNHRMKERLTLLLLLTLLISFLSFKRGVVIPSHYTGLPRPRDFVKGIKLKSKCQAEY